MKQYPVPWVTVLVVNDEGQVGLLSQEGRWVLPGKALAGGTSWRDTVRDCLAARGLTALGERAVGLYVEGESACAAFVVDDFMGTFQGTWFAPEELPVAEAERSRVKEWLESPR